MADAVEGAGEGVQVAPSVQRDNNNSKERVLVFMCICAGLIFASFMFIGIGPLQSNNDITNWYFRYPLSHVCRNDSCIIDSGNFHENHCTRNISYCNDIQPTCSSSPFTVHFVIIFIIGIITLLINVVLIECMANGNESPKMTIEMSFMINCFYFGVITMMYFVPVENNSKLNPINYRGVEYMNCYHLYSALNMLEPVYAVIWKVMVNGIYILSMQGFLCLIEAN